MTETPFGSPEAGPVKVYDKDGNLLYTQDPLPSEFNAGETLPGGPNASWVKKPDPEDEDE